MKKLLLSVLVIVAALGAVHAQPAGYLYSKPFSVTNSSPQASINYAIALLVDTHTLIAAGKMKADGSDIRFGTPCTGTKLFNYYIDTGINTANTLIYVTIDTLKPTSTRTIYMFYGNSTATAVSAIGVLDGPHTMFNQINLDGTPLYDRDPIFGYWESTSTGGDTTQAGVYFQPNQQLIVTSLGAWPIQGSTTDASFNSHPISMQLSSFDLSGGSGAVIANKAFASTPNTIAWTFTDLPQPIRLSPNNTYAVNVAIGGPNGYSWFSTSNGTPPFSSQVTVLGEAFNAWSSSAPLAQTPPFVFNSTDIEGYGDVRYYVEPAQSSYITYIPDTAINAAAGIDPLSKFACPNTNVTFTAIAGGLAPTYQWQVNTGSAWVNVNTGSTYSGVNLPTLTVSGVSTAMDGYKFRAYMTSTCGTGYSSPATLSVNTSPLITPVATISGQNPICIYNNGIFNLTTNVQGATIQWYLSSQGVGGATSPQFGFVPTANDTTVYAVVTIPNNPAVACYTVPVAVTNQIHITYGSNFTPSDSIAASNDGGCTGTIVDFTGYGNVIGGTYQWYVNGNVVPGATASTYSYPPNNGDQVTEKITTPNNGCYSVASVTSNPVVATTLYSQQPTASVAGPSNAKLGQQVTLYANITNNCGNYKVYWYNDYHLIDSTVNASTLEFTKTAGNKDFISVVVVPQSPCNGTCYQTSTQSPQLTIDFTDPNVGVGNVANQNGITVYPNPFVGKVSVAGLKAGDKLTVYDMTGRSMTTEYTATGTTEEYLLQNLAAGHYIIRVTNGEGTIKANLPISKL